MKRNKTLRTAAILLALVLISTCAMTGTLAKYVENFGPFDANVVRAGLFKVVGPGSSADITVTPNLVDGDGGQEDEADAYLGSEYAVLVPGTIQELEAEFEILNLSEVAVWIDLNTFTLTDFGAQDMLQYRPAGTSTWYDKDTFLADLNDGDDISGSILVADVLTAASGSQKLAQLGGKDTFTFAIEVLWPFADDALDYDGTTPSNDGVLSLNNDLTDTGIGKAENGQVTFTGTDPFDFDDYSFDEAPISTITFGFKALATQMD